MRGFSKKLYLFFLKKILRKFDLLLVDLTNSKTNLHSGWYMIEAKLNFQGSRAVCYFSLDGDPEKQTTKPLWLPLYSGRTSKRLIFVRTRGNLNVDLSTIKNNSEIEHFSLVRVSESFAKTRMFRKLKALHPLYKTSSKKHRLHLESNLTKSAELLETWLDYCSVFDKTENLVPYLNLIEEFDTLTDNERCQIRQNMLAFAAQPLLSIVMSIHNPVVAWLEQAITSVRSQIYTHWELCIADDASTDPALSAVLKRWTQTDPRIKVVFREKNGHLSAACNSALELAQGEWVALLNYNDMLAEHALYWVVDMINRQPDCRLIYSDEDKVDAQGVRSEPYFKCGWNADLFYSHNMFSHLGVYLATLVREVGGFRTGFEGAQDYDLALRCIEHVEPAQVQHVARVLYHWRIHADSTAHHTDAKPYAMLAGERAINEHLARRGLDAKAEYLGHGYRVRYALPAALPLVSLIIPTRNGLKLLRQCVESIFG
jgi:O-antigen biosynthesis protein